ncbi:MULTISPECIES: metallophosphoesterase [Tenebrionibacter/Tenebrionicola group]|jgi:serine/threonine protein phosphatase 1|uniref:Metallophosphoesterase n=2 Tax=Tenebrionibacter/Tenebrionicola group TaxID=2969848 RepID=A0A8K0UZ04_9ENTR|nr:MULTISPECIES: metallophosphoesterase [Tenebrionibacter/Tenebrionicola group]MBK4713814.1 metallophosphoesterase [Tenebrionibacter intestinalis]MBV5094695.1 metallophosphoesterase [Tenebrionicola larvae]
MYQRINGAAWRHIWLVGDLHGCLALFARHLRRLRFNPWSDLVISVGDLIDRGPDSPGCLALLDKPWFRAVRGNHEEMAMDALRSEDVSAWSLNGGNWFRQLDKLARAQVQARLYRCAELPLIIELHVQGKTEIVAHADYPSDSYVWGKPVDRQRVVWGRERITRHLRGEGKAIAGADRFWFGHTPLQEPLHFYNQHYIDTGAVFGNRLTLVQMQ